MKNKKDKNENENKDEKQIDMSLFDMIENKQTLEKDEQTFKEIIETWLDKKHIHFKTRLNANQVIAITILKTLASKWKVECIKELVEWFVTYKLSEGGNSSKELVDILRNKNEVTENDRLMKSIQPFIK